MTNISIWNTRVATLGGGPTTQGVAVTGANTYYSDAWMGAGVGSAVTQFYTGTPTGTFTLWGTDKHTPGLADDTDWVQITTGFTAVNPAGAAGKFASQSNDFVLKRRLKYVNASGTGTLTGFATH